MMRGPEKSDPAASTAVDLLGDGAASVSELGHALLQIRPHRLDLIG
jgi:hypothetical protein